ncbi:MAG TPA: rhodanese-like domain-containing protein [Polyangia bacterium]
MIPSPVPEIDRDSLRARLDRGDAFKLVMAGHDWAFRAKHIPGSIHFKDDREPFDGVGKDEDVVVYCSNLDCNASVALIKRLLANGYERITHYRGGLIDWEEAGLPVEGDWAMTGK